MLRNMLVLAASAAAIVSVNANAQSYSYTYAGTPGSNTSGSFTITGTVGAYTLAAFSGTVEGSAYNLSNVGIAYYTPSQIYIGGTLNGVSTVSFGTNDFFETAEFTPGSGSFSDTFTYTRVGMAGDSTVAARFTELAAAAPEPATWAMMIMGFGLAGAALRAGKRRSDAKFDARIKGIASGAIA